jgi:integrase
MALTARRVEKLKRIPGRYLDEHGLYLEVKNPRSVQWLYRYEVAHRERWVGIGPLHTFSLKEARDRARVFRQQRADGIDPQQAKREAKRERLAQLANAKSFQQVAEEYFRNHSKRWSNEKHAAQFLTTLKTYAYPIFKNKPVAQLEVQDVLKVLERPMEETTFWQARHETANRVRSRIEMVLGFATVRGYRVGDNPARWSGFLSTQLARNTKKRPQPALPYPQLPEFMADLRTQPGLAARALEFTILCTARSGAATGAQLNELDLADRVWSVPPSRAGTKISGDKPRRVPLSDRAIEILRALPTEEGNTFVFVGGKVGTGITGAAMAKVIKTMNEDRERAGLPRYVDPKLDNADIVVHGFRSCFKDWVSETTNYPNHVSEAALWHVVADKVEAAYRRGELFDKRRMLMTDWARYCGSAAKAQRRSAA